MPTLNVTRETRPDWGAFHRIGRNRNASPVSRPVRVAERTNRYARSDTAQDAENALK